MYSNPNDNNLRPRIHVLYIYIITRPAKQKPAFSWTTRRPLSLEPTKTKVVLGSLLWAPWLQLIQTEKKKLDFYGTTVISKPCHFSQYFHLKFVTAYVLCFGFSHLFTSLHSLASKMPKHDVELLCPRTAKELYNVPGFPHKTKDPAVCHS